MMARNHRIISSKVFKKANISEESFDDFIKRRRSILENQRSSISLYTSPVLVLTYFLAYLVHQFKIIIGYIQSRKWIISSIPALIILIQSTLFVEGSHKDIIYRFQSSVIWYSYWISLGIASSIGLGTGLHTFVLFLGPHIAEVTWAAYECGNLEFETYGPNRFRCQPTIEGSIVLSLWTIFKKVQLESFFWGFGTAIGELPPYFVARAAALSGSRSEELKEIDKLLKQSPESISYKERFLISIHRLMGHLGFFGIFLFASIPNPLFDLAGIICGQFLVPFTTFFGATFLGKAVVKSSIQTLIVILLFTEDTIKTILEVTRQHLPYIHDKLEEAVILQTKRLKREEGEDAPDISPSNPSYISLIWNTLFNLMLAYFALSIIETLAIAHLKRVHDQEIEKWEKKVKERAIKDDESENDDDENEEMGDYTNMTRSEGDIKKEYDLNNQGYLSS